MKENIALLRWLDTAVSGIRFGPDRRAVRAELYAHLEDRTADLLRIFPDIDPEEAQNRALAGMGDPEELKKELARVHRPWLGRLWMVSRFVLGILAALAVVALCTPDEASKNPLAGGYWGYHHQRYAPPEDPRRAAIPHGAGADSAGRGTRGNHGTSPVGNLFSGLLHLYRHRGLVARRPGRAGF